MRSSRFAAASCSRFRSPTTISLEMSLVRSSAVPNVSTSRFPSLLAQDEEELESAEEEVEPAGPVLPHGRRGPIVGADEGKRVERVEPRFEQPEEPGTPRRGRAPAALTGENPAQKTPGAQGPM